MPHCSVARRMTLISRWAASLIVVGETHMRIGGKVALITGAAAVSGELLGFEDAAFNYICARAPRW